MAAWASTSALAQAPPVAGCSTRRLPKETHVETSNSASVEVTITSPTKCNRTHVCAQAASTPNNGHAYVAASVAVLKGEMSPLIHTLTTSKRRRVTQGGNSSDERELDDSDDEAEIIVDATRRIPYRRLGLIPTQT
jgi:hypothetical protein